MPSLRDSFTDRSHVKLLLGGQRRLSIEPHRSMETPGELVMCYGDRRHLLCAENIPNRLRATLGSLYQIPVIVENTPKSIPE